MKDSIHYKNVFTDSFEIDVLLQCFKLSHSKTLQSHRIGSKWRNKERNAKRIPFLQVTLVLNAAVIMLICLEFLPKLLVLNSSFCDLSKAFIARCTITGQYLAKKLMPSSKLANEEKIKKTSIPTSSLQAET